MTKPLWSHVLTSSALTLKQAHIVSCQETRLQITACNHRTVYLQFYDAIQIHLQLSFPSETIPIRYIIGVFCNNFKLQTNILVSY